jgi:hypothetical protein
VLCGAVPNVVVRDGTLLASFGLLGENDDMVAFHLADVVPNQGERI